jgi:hypothetical protein
MMIPKKTIVEIMARALVQTLSGRPGWRRFLIRSAHQWAASSTDTSVNLALA